MDWFIDPFLSNTFLLRALIAGILVSISCGIVGTFVVLRGLAFIVMPWHMVCCLELQLLSC